MTADIDPPRGADTPGPSALVSIVIPCYNQGHFLAEAVASALAQTHQCCEVLVVDDGSTDETPAVAARYPKVRLIRQANAGLAAARNAGLRESRGDHVIFLDADDMLYPAAVALGLDCLARNPGCAFVFGGYQQVSADGTKVEEEWRPEPTHASYAALIGGNKVRVPAAALYNRLKLSAAGGFSRSPDVAGCEDYDSYLRLARQYRVASHQGLVARYRRHDGNMSRNAGLMLRAVLAVLAAQQPFLRDDPALRRILRRTRAAARRFYGGRLLEQAFAELRTAGERRADWRRLLLAGRMAPLAFSHYARRILSARLKPFTKATGVTGREKPRESDGNVT